MTPWLLEALLPLARRQVGGWEAAIIAVFTGVVGVALLVFNKSHAERIRHPQGRLDHRLGVPSLPLSHARVLTVIIGLTFLGMSCYMVSRVL